MPTKPPPPPPPRAANDKPAAEPVNVGSFDVSRGTKQRPQKVVIYGPGGVGKTTLASLASSVLFVDLEDGSDALDVARVNPTPTRLEEVRAVLQSPVVDGFDAVCLDSLTKLEELASDYVVRTVPHEKAGKAIKSIEDYGYGKGLAHVYDAFMLALLDLDNLVRRGKHVIAIAHECVAVVPNPSGDDWIRYEPRLQQPPKQGQIRSRVKEWCDHLLFVGYDVFASDGKATGSGTRTIYPTEMPTHMAKSRRLREPLPFTEGDGALWEELLQ